MFLYYLSPPTFSAMSASRELILGLCVAAYGTARHLRGDRVVAALRISDHECSQPQHASHTVLSEVCCMRDRGSLSPAIPRSFLLLSSLCGKRVCDFVALFPFPFLYSRVFFSCSLFLLPSSPHARGPPTVSICRASPLCTCTWPSHG
jgi:hypothetical protein